MFEKVRIILPSLVRLESSAAKTPVEVGYQINQPKAAEHLLCLPVLVSECLNNWKKNPSPVLFPRLIMKKPLCRNKETSGKLFTSNLRLWKTHYNICLILQVWNLLYEFFSLRDFFTHVKNYSKIPMTFHALLLSPLRHLSR